MSTVSNLPAAKWRRGGWGSIQRWRACRSRKVYGAPKSSIPEVQVDQPLWFTVGSGILDINHLKDQPRLVWSTGLRGIHLDSVSGIVSFSRLQMPCYGRTCTWVSEAKVKRQDRVNARVRAAPSSVHGGMDSWQFLQIPNGEATLRATWKRRRKLSGWRTLIQRHFGSEFWGDFTCFLWVQTPIVFLW